MRVGRTYVYQRNSSENKCMVFGILTVLAAVGFLYTAYKSYTSLVHYRDVSASFGRLNYHSGYNSRFDPNHNGDVIHVNIPQQQILFERNAYDPYFNVEVPGAVTLSRNVEYCQWQQHTHETTHKNNDGTETVSRTYTYTKYWRPHRINSLFFDQPAAHHNPQRDPVHGGSVDSIGISSQQGYSIAAPYMKQLKVAPSIISFRPERLQKFVSSPAATVEKFFYTGNNGYFLSKYQPSAAETAMKMAFQYVEGTLLDFQLGDLFSVCDAGDIRVQLRGKTVTNGVSHCPAE